MMRSMALLGLLAILAACSSSAGSPQPPAVNVSASAAAGLPGDARYLGMTVATGGCIGTTEERLAVLELMTGADIHNVLPGALGTPELDAVKAPIRLVIYKGGWPGPITGAVGTERRPPKAGTWDVCVSRPDGGDIGGLPFIVYSGVKSDGSPVTPQ